MPITFRHKIAKTEAKLLGATPALIATAASGARYQLQHAFADLASAQRLAAKVLEKGTIDPALWTMIGAVPGSAADIALRAEAISATRPRFLTGDAYRERHAREMGLAA